VVLQEIVLPVAQICATATLHSHDFFTKVHLKEKDSLAKRMLSQWVVDTFKNNCTRPTNLLDDAIDPVKMHNCSLFTGT
jgi:hypothetical protein